MFSQGRDCDLDTFRTYFHNREVVILVKTFNLDL